MSKSLVVILKEKPPWRRKPKSPKQLWTYDSQSPCKHEGGMEHDCSDTDLEKSNPTYIEKASTNHPKYCKLGKLKNQAAFIAVGLQSRGLDWVYHRHTAPKGLLCTWTLSHLRLILNLYFMPRFSITYSLRWGERNTCASLGNGWHFIGC